MMVRPHPFLCRPHPSCVDHIPSCVDHIPGTCIAKEKENLLSLVISHVLPYMVMQEAEIKKAAKRGDKQSAGVYAKQLVRLRQQKTKSLGLSAQITSTGHKMTVSYVQDTYAHTTHTRLSVVQLGAIFNALFIFRVLLHSATQGIALVLVTWKLLTAMFPALHVSNKWCL